MIINTGCNVLIDPGVGFLTFLNGKHFNVDPHEFARKTSVQQFPPASCGDHLILKTLTWIFGKTYWLDCEAKYHRLSQGENLMSVKLMRRFFLLIFKVPPSQKPRKPDRSFLHHSAKKRSSRLSLKPLQLLPVFTDKRRRK